VLRWFHPSDAADAIDWDRFALDGVRRVIDAPDRRALRARLAELSGPIAPTMQLVAEDEKFVDMHIAQGLRNSDLEVVAWEHEGYGDTTIRSVYASKRRHRDRTVLESGRASGALWQAIDATPFRGARLRLRGKIRTANHGAGRLWLRVDRGDNRILYDRMEDRPVIAPTWETAEITGFVDNDATRIAFGPVISGAGTAWYDDLELSKQDSNGHWVAIPIKDPGFEFDDVFRSWAAGTGSASAAPLKGWRATLDHANPASGKAALRLEPGTKVLTEELFAEAPAPGETVDIDLGQGLRARVPIALYSKEGHTVGDDPAVARQSQAEPAPSSSNGFDALSSLADVIVVWNVLEHFWPYWHVVSVDWNAELDTALADALDDRTVDDHVATLQRLSVAAPDGHAEVTCAGASPRAYLPFLVEWIENQIVVTTTADKAIVRGDVIVSIDGRPAKERFLAEEALASGSPQYRTVVACREFGTGPVGSKAALRVRRADAYVDVGVTRGDRVSTHFSRPPIEPLSDGTYYVDLGRAGINEIKRVIERLAVAPGVVFDLRGYPNGNDEILSYLLTTPADFAEGMKIPRLIRPDHVRASIVGWRTESGDVPVLAPHIRGRVAFLTGPGARSYAESVMSIVEHYHLAEIVGGATAGTNGNIAEIAAPTGCRTIFTGLRVSKRDGTPHHLVGVRPTIPASQTIAGVIAGRDEVLERALTYVRTGAK
jgi:hypothetical protein